MYCKLVDRSTTIRLDFEAEGGKAFSIEKNLDDEEMGYDDPYRISYDDWDYDSEKWTEDEKEEIKDMLEEGVFDKFFDPDYEF